MTLLDTNRYNIVMLSGLYPKCKIEEYVSKSYGMVQFAADALQWSFAIGLNTVFQNNFSVITLPYIGSYPKYSKIIHVKSCDFNYNGIKGSCIKYNNIGIYKRFSIYKKTKCTLQKWISSKEGKTIIIVYAINSSFLMALSYLKKKNPNIIVIQIVPDLTEYMSDNKSIIYKFLKMIDHLLLDKLYYCIDSYVLLSQYMNEKLPIQNKPFTVIEGIYNPDDIIKDCNYISENRFILYTGTLASRYGIINLVKAFHKCSLSQVELVICGDGDSKELIFEYSKKDPRIKFLGHKNRDEILSLQKKATLLINPRTPEGEYTKYSFPSKIMEYFASGTPSLLYKLPGVPSEYYKYCYTIEILGEDALKDRLEYILNLPKEDLIEMGVRAQNFIIENKTPRKQCEKILDLINKL